MKAITTIFILSFSSTLISQGNLIEVWPWNPNSDNNELIGTADLTNFLSVFGTSYSLSPEPCDYDGTAIEDWLSQAFTGEIEIDSIYWSYTLYDVQADYNRGCPEPITDTVVYSNVVMLKNPYLYNSSTGIEIRFTPYSWKFIYSGATGGYKLYARDFALNDLGFTGDGFFGGGHERSSNHVFLPFPEDTYMDDNGLHFGEGWWESYQWPFYVTEWTMLPYWHIAE